MNFRDFFSRRYSLAIKRTNFLCFYWGLQATLGQRKGISAIDARQMNLLYMAQCSERECGGGNGGGNYNV